jgi:hypothetical protein
MHMKSSLEWGLPRDANAAGACSYWLPAVGHSAVSAPGYNHTEHGNVVDASPCLIYSTLNFFRSSPSASENDKLARFEISLLMALTPITVRPSRGETGCGVASGIWQLK